MRPESGPRGKAFASHVIIIRSLYEYNRCNSVHCMCGLDSFVIPLFVGFGTVLYPLMKPGKASGTDIFKRS